MKRKYSEIKFELIEISGVDILTTSDGSGTGSSGALDGGSLPDGWTEIEMP